MRIDQLFLYRRDPFLLGLIYEPRKDLAAIVSTVSLIRVMSTGLLKELRAGGIYVLSAGATRFRGFRVH